MTTLHLNYYELSREVKDSLKNSIFNNWYIKEKQNKIQHTHEDIIRIKEQIEKMFDIDNAGIEVEIYEYLK
jgi:hypothetical protein